MPQQHYQFGEWNVSCIPEDGGRLGRLAYGGFDLLTASPDEFRPPAADYGLYETRPVFGYDDCFPTVDPCYHPDWGDIPDHGELCWMDWMCEARDDTLSFRTQSRRLPLTFRRTMRFFPGEVVWQFEVHSQHVQDLPMLHVMHALLPLNEVCGVRVPEFSLAIDEIEEEPAELETPDDVADHLLARPEESTAMLLLRGVETGIYEVAFRTGLRLQVHFESDLFPTLGIWWNRGCYPDEDGCRRTECAFEPIPGAWSSLARATEEAGVPLVPAGEGLGWEVSWIIREDT